MRFIQCRHQIKTVRVTMGIHDGWTYLFDSRTSFILDDITEAPSYACPQIFLTSKRTGSSVRTLIILLGHLINLLTELPHILSGECQKLTKDLLENLLFFRRNKMDILGLTSGLPS